MPLDVTSLEMWAAEVEDKPGALAFVLGTLAEAGANFEFVLARRSASPGKGVVFVTPVRGAKQTRAARKAGFEKTRDLFALRVAMPDRPGLCAHLTREMATHGLNIRGLSASAMGKRCILHVAFDSAAAAGRAANLLAAI